MKKVLLNVAALLLAVHVVIPVVAVAEVQSDSAQSYVISPDVGDPGW